MHEFCDVTLLRFLSLLSILLSMKLLNTEANNDLNCTYNYVLVCSVFSSLYFIAVIVY